MNQRTFVSSKVLFLSVLTTIFLFFSHANAANNVVDRMTRCFSDAVEYTNIVCSGFDASWGMQYPKVSYFEDHETISFRYYCLQSGGDDSEPYRYHTTSCTMGKTEYKGPPPSLTIALSPAKESPKDAVCAKKGSIIDMTTRTVGEQIPLSGLPFLLSYNSGADSSRPANRMLEYREYFPEYHQQETIPYKELRLYVNSIKYWETDQPLGQTYVIYSKEVIPLNYFNNQLFNFTASVGIAVYASLPFRDPSNPFENIKIPLSGGSQEISVYKPEVWGLGGWTLSNHHYYDSAHKIIRWGSGGQSEKELPIKNMSGLGNVYLATDESGSEVYLFDSLGRHIETRTSLMGIPIYQFKYLPDHKLDKIIDRDQLVTQIERDSSGNPIAIRAPFGQRTLFSVNSNGKLSELENSVGGSFEISYQNGGSGLVSQIKYPSGLITNFEYDNLGFFKQESKNNGAVQQLVYAFVQEIKQMTFLKSSGIQETTTVGTNQQGQQETNVTDTSGTRILKSLFTDTNEVKDLGIMTIQAQYQDDIRFGDLAKAQTEYHQTVPGLPYSIANKDVSTSYAVTYTQGDGPFNVNELTTQAFEPSYGNGPRLTTTVFRGPSRTLETSTGPNDKRKIYFDSKERVTKIESSDSLDTYFQFNALGQLEKVKQGASENSFVYNSQGTLAQSIDPWGRATSFERNSEGQVTKKTLPNGDVIEMSYDSSGNLKELKTPNSQVHKFNYSILDQLISYVSSNNQNETITEHDNFGRTLKITKPSGAQAKYFYKQGTDFVERIETPEGNYSFNQIDPYGRPLQVISPDGIRTQITWIGNELSTIEQFDGATPIGSIIRQVLGSFFLSYVTVGGTNILTYDYDTKGRMIRAGDEFYLYETSKTAQPESATVTIKSNPNFNYGVQRTQVKVVTDGASVGNLNYTSRSFSSIYVDLSDTTYKLDSLSDKTGKIVRSSVQKDENPAVFDYYQYDANSRLTGASGRLSASYEFPQGSNNNISKYTHGSKVTTASYDSEDRLLALHGAIERNFEYTDDGNLAKISNCLGEKKYEYDFFGNLKKVTLPNGKIIEYKYDAFNRRVARLENNVIKNYYVWQDSTHLGAILGPQAEVQIQYVYGIHPVAPIYFIKYGVDQGVYSVLANDRGDIRYVVNRSTGALVQEIEYDEYGMILSDSSVTSQNPEGFQPLGFVSGLTDRETSLVRFGARDYDPVVGRWNAKDPIGFAGGDTNLFSYSANDPINNIDPNGLSYLIFDQGTNTLYVYSGQGQLLGTFGAGNNVVKSVGTSPLQEGEAYSFAYPKNHSAEPNGPFGSNGNFVFNVPGHQGVGVHAGRANKGGPAHPTEGCIRTTDNATDLIKKTHVTDPLTSLIIINSNR